MVTTEMRSLEQQLADVMPKCTAAFEALKTAKPGDNQRAFAECAALNGRAIELSDRYRRAAHAAGCTPLARAKNRKA